MTDPVRRAWAVVRQRADLCALVETHVCAHGSAWRDHRARIARGADPALAREKTLRSLSRRGRDFDATLEPLRLTPEQAEAVFTITESLYT